MSLTDNIVYGFAMLGFVFVMFYIMGGYIMLSVPIDKEGFCSDRGLQYFRGDCYINESNVMTKVLDIQYECKQKAIHELFPCKEWEIWGIKEVGE